MLAPSRDPISGRGGNNGQRNPTYFAVGALVNHLRRLRDERGVPTERVLAGYALLTAANTKVAAAPFARWR